MTDRNGLPPGSMAYEMAKLAEAGAEVKRVILAELTRALGPVVDYMAKVGRHDRP